MSSLHCPCPVSMYSRTMAWFVHRQLQSLSCITFFFFQKPKPAFLTRATTYVYYICICFTKCSFNRKTCKPYRAYKIYCLGTLFVQGTFVQCACCIMCISMSAVSRCSVVTAAALENWPLSGLVSPWRSIFRSELPPSRPQPLIPERAAAAHPRWDANLMLKEVEFQIPKYILLVI